MAAPRREGAGDRDDWFADVEPQDALERDPPSAEDDWLVPVEPTRAATELPWGRIALFGGLGIVALVAILGAAGVFSSSSKPRALTTPIVTVPTATTPAQKQTKPAVRVLPTATLKPGDTGSQVKALQRALKSLGYPVGTVDGQYGPATKTAVAAFQHKAGLTEDGVFGPKTLNALIHRAGP
jgi:hypothetical protein